MALSWKNISKFTSVFFSRRRKRSGGEMSKGHFRISSKVSFRKIYIGQRMESETDSWYQEAWDWMFFIFSASKKLENEEKESECYMSWSATFHAKGKLRPTSSLLEPRVQAWGGHRPSFQTHAGHLLGCLEQRGPARSLFQGLISWGWGQAGCYERTVLIFPLVTS